MAWKYDGPFSLCCALVSPPGGWWRGTKGAVSYVIYCVSVTLCHVIAHTDSRAAQAVNTTDMSKLHSVLCPSSLEIWSIM